MAEVTITISQSQYSEALDIASNSTLEQLNKGLVAAIEECHDLKEREQRIRSEACDLANKLTAARKGVERIQNAIIILAREATR